ncbi:hypothetical protein [Clostridium sp. 001]|uniref:hypothetical protein n=1 Tax=Clostridium sp. 001 TaxID=1970093 RepID=UPI001C2CAA69|nr:hypothetical protein [Clostridium sp. 001]QXE19745.1 hypothetical protein B5S50_13440 [Clostridium sp. 001]
MDQYETDITIKKEDKFQKIGERFIEINKIDSKHVEGKYYETFLKGYENYSSNTKSFNFKGNFQDQSTSADFSTTTSYGNNIKGNIYISPTSANINFNIDNEPEFDTDSSFNKILN